MKTEQVMFNEYAKYVYEKYGIQLEDFENKYIEEDENEYED